MEVITHISQIGSIANPDIRQLVQHCIDNLGGEEFDSASLGYLLVIEPCDTLEAIQAQIGFDILVNRWTGLRYNHPDFTPSFELIEDCGTCFDLVFVLSDSGYGVEVFVPKSEGIPPELLDMCRRFALPGKV